MRPRGWSSFWTIIAAIAGVVGAGAAVYPLLNSDQQMVHLTFNEDLDILKVETLSEPVILTGNWYVKKGPRWSREFLRTGDILGASLKDTRITTNERKSLFLDKTPLEAWARGKEVPCKTLSMFACREFLLVSCSEDDAGALEVGVEFKSKSGVSWARSKLPFCVQIWHT